jgi:hypothetical protein
MTTGQLLRVHRELEKAGELEKAKAFVERNSQNKRFVSLVELRQSFLNAFREAIKQYGC